MKNINADSFREEVLNYKGVVIADFYADWCPPCRMLSPIIEELDRENKSDSVKFVKINVDSNQQLSSMYGVASIPTVIFFKNGQMVVQKVGFDSKEVYQGTIDQIKNAKKIT